MTQLFVCLQKIPFPRGKVLIHASVNLASIMQSPNLLGMGWEYEYAVGFRRFIYPAPTNGKAIVAGWLRFEDERNTDSLVLGSAKFMKKYWRVPRV